MANPNAPFGFRPIKSLSGSSLQVNYYKVGSAASRIGKGDLLKLKSDGTVERETSATAVGPWIGVSAKDSGTISAAISKFPVFDDASVVFEIQSKKTSAHSTTDLNQIYKVDCSATPNTDTGLSKNAMTTTAATASNGVRLLRIVDDPANESGEYQRVEVRINAHQSAPGTAGV